MENAFGVGGANASQGLSLQTQALQAGVESQDASQNAIEKFRSEMQRIAAESTQDSIKNDAVTKMLNEAKQTSQAFSRG